MPVSVDTKDFDLGMTKLEARIRGYQTKIIMDVGLELMRLSQFQVPHDTGLLQNSGFTERRNENEVLVGYNKVYAAKLHEHPEYRFQKGRKGKYLEEPMKTNLHVFRRIYEDGLREILQ